LSVSVNICLVLACLRHAPLCVLCKRYFGGHSLTPVLKFIVFPFGWPPALLAGVLYHFLQYGGWQNNFWLVLLALVSWSCAQQVLGAIGSPMWTSSCPANKARAPHIWGHYIDITFGAFWDRGFHALSAVSTFLRGQHSALSMCAYPPWHGNWSF